METRWGKRFGRYEVVAELGSGAMGVVYKARDPKIDRFVAVKTISLSSQNAEEEREFRERFFHEAQAAGRLLHPGIVTIFDTGEDPDGHIAFIVMEFIAGQSLDRLLSEKTKKLPLDTALLLAEDLAEALDHAHGQGVIHRDMKPANILVTTEGHAKIADFGIAKLNLSNLTLPGRVLGTPAYMSPEQLEGEPVDRRSDLFSLGAILYHMVTGYGPFQGNSATTVCFKVANREPVRATALDPDLPPQLDAVIARAMAKDSAQRYQRGLEFALDLRELRERLFISKKNYSTSQFPRSGEGVTRSHRSSTTDIRLANRVRGGFFRMPVHPARQAHTLIRQLVLSWGQKKVVRIGLVFAVAAMILSLFAYKSLRSPNSTQIRPLATVAASEPAPAASVPIPSASEPAPATSEKAPAVSEPNASHHTAGHVSNSKTSSRTVADSTLDIRIEHRFSSADLSLWIDDQLTCDRPLRGQVKKHWSLFRTDVRETERVRLTAGNHRIIVRVRSAPDKYEQSASILGSFAKDHPAILKINFERQGNAMRLALR